ncbi:MAG: glycosyltransferase [Burkholderiaceae bacterium]
MLAIPFEYYLRPVDWIGVAVLVPSVLLMVLILLANGFEFAEMFWRGNLGRRFAAKPLPAHLPQPKVSIHLACCNEPPDMVIATINSLLALDYQNFEVLVIDNNTRDEAMWRPVQEHVARLDQRFRFFHLPKWPGYKAGALNFALSQTSPDAQIIGVVDADYLVRPNWLRDLVGHFEPGVAVVQAPQAHRDWGRQVFQRMMNWEFDGFFRIGMHHRNERDAIIQHGTMMLVRADLLRAHGNWSEWCICEDTELGLRLMQAGWSSVYVDEVMGQGLTPDHFAAFRKQRRRWAQGGMQILRGHAAELLTWRGKAQGARLTPAQRYHFVAGWMSWFGDALHLVFAFAAMFWTIGIMAVPHLVSLPILLFMLPVFVFFAGKAVMGPLLYWARVPCSLKDSLGAAVAGMGLSHGIATGVFAGLTGRSAVFEITAKGAGAAGGRRRESGWMAALAASRFGKAVGMAREEAGLLLAMTLCIIGMAVTRKADHIESALWMSILALQAVPYLAAVTCAWLSGAKARVTEPEERSGRLPIATRHEGANAMGSRGALATRTIVG